MISDSDRSEGRALVFGRLCVCGHFSTDHSPECEFGWGNEPGESPACSCERFVFAANLVGPGRLHPAPSEGGEG